MDPDAALELILDRARTIIASFDENTEGGDLRAIAELASDLAEATINLNEWISREGFLPSQWATTEGALPTVAQGIALARFLRGRWDGEGIQYNATVAHHTPGQMEGYVLVRMVDGYECGIDREGRVST